MHPPPSGADAAVAIVAVILSIPLGRWVTGVVLANPTGAAIVHFVDNAIVPFVVNLL